MIPNAWVRTDEFGDWRDVLSELPTRIHEWMPRLAAEKVVGADAIFACLGPALEIFSRYSRVEKASGEQVKLKEYLEYVWAAVAKEALNMIFEGADATGFEEDARLTAMWLWTLSTGSNGNGVASDVQPDAADLGEHIPAHQQAGPRDRRVIRDGSEAVAIAGPIPPGAVESVDRRRAAADDHARVLHRAVRVEEPRADAAD